MKTPSAASANPPSSVPWRTRRPFVAVGAALVLAWPVAALADCPDTRKATAAEIDFHARATAALLAALPPVPAGGSLQNDDRVTTLGQQCKGTSGDFTVEVSRWYQHNHRLAIVSVSMNVPRLPGPDTVPFAAYGSASPARSAGLQVHNVVWKVSGSDSPLRKGLADAIDRERLQAMLGKPLPSVAESRAFAAQAAPVTIGTVPAPAPAAPTANAPAQQPAAQAAVPATQPVAPNAAVPDPVGGAVDAVNKLRGLFGR